MCLLLNQRRFQSKIHCCDFKVKFTVVTVCAPSLSQCAMRLSVCSGSDSQAGPGKTQEKPEETRENLGRVESGKLWKIQGNCFLPRLLTVRTRWVSKCLEHFEFTQPIVLIISIILIILIIPNPRAPNPRADKHTQQNSELSFHHLPWVCWPMHNSKWQWSSGTLQAIALTCGSWCKIHGCHLNPKP